TWNARWRASWPHCRTNTGPGSEADVALGDSVALTKAEMAERLYEEVGLNKREAKEFVDAFFTALREALESGRQVKLSGFGNFDVRSKEGWCDGSLKAVDASPRTVRTVGSVRPGQKVRDRV